MLCVALRQSHWLIVWLLVCAMMCPAEADCEPQSIHIAVYPVGTGLCISLSPSLESKRVMALSARLLMRMHRILTQKMLHRPWRNLLLHHKGGYRNRSWGGSLPMTCDSNSYHASTHSHLWGPWMLSAHGDWVYPYITYLKTIWRSSSCLWPSSVSNRCTQCLPVASSDSG